MYTYIYIYTYNDNDVQAIPKMHWNEKWHLLRSPSLSIPQKNITIFVGGMVTILRKIGGLWHGFYPH